MLSFVSIDTFLGKVSHPLRAKNGFVLLLQQLCGVIAMVIFVLSLLQEELGLWEFMLQRHAGIKSWLEHVQGEGDMLFRRFKSVI